ncbi:MAG: UDP-N-acetylmuramoyl-L-alanine--D-glutamate ligase [Planctomycetes bacterium]|nr:UDP-N-acetylmuramoyl-L-alanine--D-glutamate ligase [Planctomycetota bacterium]
MLVVGLGRLGGGVGVTRWLIDQGAEVTVSDRATPQSLAESVRSIDHPGVTLHLGGHDLHDPATADLAVINPAIDKARCEIFGEIVRRGIPWTTEINLFCERCPAMVIGVTGTYGKSTTCAMLAHVLEATDDPQHAGSTVYLGGNIGRSLLGDLKRMKRSDVVILELSHRQLEDVPRIGWVPSLAVITNLSPHHLDDYPNVDHYYTAKLNIAADSKKANRVVVGELDEQARAIFERIVPAKSGRVRSVQPLDPPVILNVPGRHNQGNAACVLEVCAYLSRDRVGVREALRSFAGLPHRLEHVRILGGVDYYNDSKSTSPTATITAVHAFDRPVVAIVGGQDKGVSLTACAQVLAHRCRAVICTGQSSAKLAGAVHEARQAPASAASGSASPCASNHSPIRPTDRDREDESLQSLAIREAATLEEAVRLAGAQARKGDVILFTPGAPSFDTYANFAQRGDHFINIVNSL